MAYNTSATLKHFPFGGSVDIRSLNLKPPAPLYLRTLWRYTNAVIIIIIIIIIIILPISSLFAQAQTLKHVSAVVSVPYCVTAGSSSWSRTRLCTSQLRVKRLYHWWTDGRAVLCGSRLHRPLVQLPAWSRHRCVVLSTTRYGIAPHFRLTFYLYITCTALLISGIQ